MDRSIERTGADPDMLTMVVDVAMHALFSEGEVVLGFNDRRQTVRLYPNPVMQYDYINIDLDRPIDHIEIFDMRGNKRLDQRSKQMESRLSTYGLEPGLYFVRINDKAVNRFLVR